ncbi:MAG: transcription elongation factor GreA [Muribaculaceae bacterium]|nr:transcription elongation factor GreA [Muribaculaceae bacterium]MBQ2563762.1 transcription elongation factor GreA [Muribaculaceae bacterium]MBQ5408750.1 transcription elongation factor GreA [Muribaculaceae bacterium]MDY6294614.1 transcription elongation factor GreA [Bacteroidales bacterium]MDY6412049.1 transcription elongation factor GreA [Bacteroidales bacterium]
MAISYMTKAGYDKKMQELANLENVERPAVVQAIVEAREKGDLSENAEYDAARERQGMLEAKIAELKNLIAGARIIDESKINTDEVQLLTKVTIMNVANKAKMTYTIVTETESNLREGKISITTPIAKGLVGHKVGDVVEIQAPAGTMKFEILEISI